MDLKVTRQIINGWSEKASEKVTVCTGVGGESTGGGGAPTPLHLVCDN